NHEPDGIETVALIVHLKNASLLRRVTGINGDADLLIAMRLMQRISPGMRRRRRSEVLLADKERCEQNYSGGNPRGFHSPIISSPQLGLHIPAVSIEWLVLNVCPLQSAFGRCGIALAAVVGFADAAPGQISRRVYGAPGSCACA